MDIVSAQMYAEAESLHRAGFPVVPTALNGKPLVSLVSLQLMGPTSIDINHWFDGREDAVYLGLMTGWGDLRRSLVAVRVPWKNGSVLKLSPTACFADDFGLNYLYYHPYDCEEIRGSVDILGPGIEVVAKDGILVVPPKPESCWILSLGYMVDLPRHITSKLLSTYDLE